MTLNCGTSRCVAVLALFLALFLHLIFSSLPFVLFSCSILSAAQLLVSLMSLPWTEEELKPKRVRGGKKAKLSAVDYDAAKAQDATVCKAVAVQAPPLQSETSDRDNNQKRVGAVGNTNNTRTGIAEVSKSSGHQGKKRKGDQIAEMKKAATSPRELTTKKKKIKLPEDSTFASVASAVPLMDRLNPSRPGFDAGLKEAWKSMSERQKKNHFKADLQMREEIKELLAQQTQNLPFPVEPSDHCETSLQAYGDIAPLLAKLAKSLRVSHADLRIYDPYFCTGSTVSLLASLGFPNVINNPEDFYERMRKHEAGEEPLPFHHVLVTNPPYSGTHLQRIVQFCAKRKDPVPYFLLLPKFVDEATWYTDLFSSSTSSCVAPLLLCPKRRYNFWSPAGCRPADEPPSQSTTINQFVHPKDQVSLTNRQRTSPFVAIWYLTLSPALSSADAIEWFQKKRKRALKEAEKEATLTNEKKKKNEAAEAQQKEKKDGDASPFPGMLLVSSRSELPDLGWEGGGGKFQPKKEKKSKEMKKQAAADGKTAGVKQPEKQTDIVQTKPKSKVELEIERRIAELERKKLKLARKEENQTKKQEGAEKQETQEAYRLARLAEKKAKKAARKSKQK